MKHSQTEYLKALSKLAHCFETLSNSYILRPFQNWRTSRSNKIIIGTENLDLDHRLLSKKSNTEKYSYKNLITDWVYIAL